jgi:anti-sigma factor RsiW
VSDVTDPEQIDPILAAELAALADGSLPPEHVAALERRIAASPELAAALADQRRARAATRPLANAMPSARLRESVTAMVAEATATATERPARWSWRRRWALPAAALAAVVVAIVIAVGPGGGPAPPSVAEAARTALRPASPPAPATRPQTNELAVTVDGVAFPDWYANWGWRAVGSRSDVVGGRRVETVAYANRRGQRIGYAIVAGAALPVADGRVVVRNGVRMRVLEDARTSVVTWRRDGRTCVLAARGVDAATLVRLASWSSA